MPTFTALTTLTGKPAAEALGEAMERLIPEPTGIGVFEVEDGSGLWEVGGYFTEHPDETALSLLSAAMVQKSLRFRNFRRQTGSHMCVGNCHL